MSALLFAECNRLPIQMHVITRISITANLLLAAVLCCLVLHERSAAQRSSWTGPDGNLAGTAPPKPEPATAAKPESASADARPFDWSRLESSDYRVYVANLRRVRCPEQTIRDILTADVHSLYAPRRERLEEMLTGGAVGRQRTEEQLVELRKEEAAVLAHLLGDQRWPSQTASPPRVARSSVLPLACQRRPGKPAPRPSATGGHQSGKAAIPRRAWRSRSK